MPILKQGEGQLIVQEANWTVLKVIEQLNGTRGKHW
jgi:hypothetical protein